MGPKGPTLQPIPKTSAPSGLAQRSGIPRPAWNFRLMCLFLAPSGSFLELLRAISLFRRCFRQGRPHGKARPRLKAEAPSHVSHCARLPGSGSGSFAMARGPVLGPVLGPKIGPPGIPMFLRRSARSELWLWPRPWTSGVLNSRLSDSVSVRLRLRPTPFSGSGLFCGPSAELARLSGAERCEPLPQSLDSWLRPGAEHCDPKRGKGALHEPARCGHHVQPPPNSKARAGKTERLRRSHRLLPRRLHECQPWALLILWEALTCSLLRQRQIRGQRDRVLRKGQKESEHKTR